MHRSRPFMLGAISIPLFSFTPGVAAQTTPAKPDNPNEVEIVWGAKIPMRDGVRLNATLYKPAGAAARLPVIFTLTPYISDSYHERAFYFARNQYVFALVDVRGRGNSAGAFEPFVNDARDGHDLVEWFAAQPWCDGQVTMWGGSYAGFNQWATLKEFPSHLKTIVPAAAAFPGVDFPYFKNIFFSYDTQWLTYTSGVTPNAKLFNEAAYWISRFREMYLHHRPFRELDTIVGNSSPHFQEWLRHPMPDAYFDAMVPAADAFGRMDLPILTISGHYDDDQPGALRYYYEHMKHAPPAAREKHYLILGPWDHAGTRTPKKEVGGLVFGDACMLDLNQLHKEWYDWTLKGGPKPAFLKKRVAYYVMAANEWKYADRLEDVANDKRTFYLDSAGDANDVFRSGRLSPEKPQASPPDKYVYDPLDVRPAALEREDIANYLTDQRSALHLFGNGLVYHSEPFAEATEISGQLKFSAWIALDVPDTDFQVSVYEILADGSSVRLAGDLLRARYRESLRRETPAKPDAINRYDFDGFYWISRRVAQGSRLRLVLSSPNSIYIQKNYNSGGAIANESGQDARTAHVTVYHDAEHPSYLEIPVARTPTTTGAP